MNRYICTARLGADPEVKALDSGKTVTKVRLAISDGFGEKKRTIWVDGEAWDKTAEIIGERLKKGDAAIFDGRLKMDEWKTKDDQTRTAIRFVIERMEFMTGKRQADEPQADDGIPV